MEIGGLQKVSTIDYLGEICCVIFLRGCNFRCGFCYNSELVVGDDGELTVNSGQWTVEGVLDFLKRRVGKLDAVCISGGEPLMSLDFDFLRKIKEMGFKIKVDTNGSFPERLAELIDEKLVDYIAMDVKGCRRDYARIVNAEVDLGKIEESMKIVYDFGERGIGTRMNADTLTKNRQLVGADPERGFFRRSEFRTTIVGRLHSKESVVEMGKWMNEVCGGKPRRIFLQGFKNKGDFVDSSFKEERDVLEKELAEIKDKIDEFFWEVGIRV